MRVREYVEPAPSPKGKGARKGNTRSKPGKYDTQELGRTEQRDHTVIPFRKPGRLAKLWQKLSGIWTS